MRYPRHSGSYARRVAFCLTIFAGCLCLAAANPVSPHAGTDVPLESATPLEPGVRFDRLLIEKKARRLTAFAKGKPVRVFRVSLGQVPVGAKRVQGDKKTPEGVYTVDGKNPFSRFYKNLGVSYPSEADRARAASLGKSPGGDIKIHDLGPEFRDLGKDHWKEDWTLGCIAVTDEEIDELYAHTDMGAVIEIAP